MSQMKAKPVIKLGKRQKYDGRILALVDKTPELQTADVHHIAVYHDDYCGVFKGGDCNCDPDVGSISEEAALRLYQH